MKFFTVLKNPYKSPYVSYVLPAAVILFFGMVALHSAVLLIDAQRKFRTDTTYYTESVIALQSAYNDFSSSYNRYKDADKTVEPKALVDEFTLLYDKGRNFIESISSLKNSQKFEAYIHRSEKMQQSIKTLASQIADLKDKKKNSDRKKLTEAIALKIQDIKSDLDHLNTEAQAVINGFLDYSDVRTRQVHLYWSVIAIGFCGFVMVLLNADKLRQLKRNNNEKIRYLDLLESRLAALEAAHDGIVIIDSGGNVSFINGAMCRMLDVESGEQKSFVSRQWRTLFAEDEMVIIEEDVLPQLEESGYWMGALPLYHGDGTIVHTDFSITKLLDGGMIITAMDVSEKQRMESEKRQFEDQFYQAQKMEAIGRLAGGIAHDFNNILAAINGYAEFLTEDLDTASEQHKFASNIIQAGRQAKDLVDQILEFSRRKDSTRKAMDFLESVQEATSMMAASFPKTVELKTDIKVSRAVITGNANQISQVLMNLCVNAGDAMEDERGTLTIGVEDYRGDKSFCVPDAVRRELPDPKGVPFLALYDIKPAHTRLIVGHIKDRQDYIKLSIEDTGTGMSRTVMEHIFEPFFTTKPVDKGTGLGLATVHGVVIGHSGALVIDSVIGKGTRFDLYFPAAQEDAMTEQNESSQTHGLSHVSLNILLVEDQAYVLDMMQKMLTRAGHIVFTARDGVEALLFLKENGDKIDLVITDQNMPKMTGIEMIEQIYIDLPDMQFLVISGYSEKQMQEMIDRHPAIKGVLRKPVSSADIQEKIEQIMKQKARQGVKKIAS